jgi:hypothetical protein
MRIPKGIEHQVREECGQACANPKCRAWSTAKHQLHHIDGDRSNSRRENLILFCANCHGQQIAGIISEADVKLWKRMAEGGGLTSPTGKPRAEQFVMRDNYGIAAQNVTVGTVKLHQERHPTGRREVTPGLIEADPDMRTYATYLVGKYIDWRKKGRQIDGRLFAAGSAHGILSEGFGSPTSVLLIPQTKFQSWTAQAQRKIDRTTFGRINNSRGNRNYHSWEEHLTERHGERGKMA